MKNKPITIAIDGPAASGKSTTARTVARRLGYIYIDTGAMYRAVTLKALQENLPVNQSEEVARIAREIDLKFGRNNKKTEIYMDGEEVSEAIRQPEIDKNISPVAANPLVRKILVRKQQKLGQQGGVVLDGRDIGTVVFPDAELKIFMIASVDERARRRQKEQLEKGINANLREIMEDLRYRDAQDSGRSHGPLKKAPDAIKIDTTELSIDQQVEKILKLAENLLND